MRLPEASTVVLSDRDDFDEARRALDPVDGRGVIGDEALAENALVHRAFSIASA